jgi:hypothetical protein
MVTRLIVPVLASLLAATCSPAVVPGDRTPPASVASANEPAVSPPEAPTVASLAPCPVTRFETIPPNDVVGWDQATWQRAVDGVWGNPLLGVDGSEGGFHASDSAFKILWWVLDGENDPLVLTLRTVPDHTVITSASFDAPGPNRHDRPSDLPMPPPGCYEIQIKIGARSGAIVDRVLP